jgi:hypothetical protein
MIDMTGFAKSLTIIAHSLKIEALVVIEPQRALNLPRTQNFIIAPKL